MPRGAEAPQLRLRPDLDEAEPGHRLRQATGSGTLLPPRLTLAAVVERRASLDPTRELELGKTGGPEVRRVAHGNGPREPLDLVVEVDAGRTPHHDLCRLVPLEPFDRAPVHPAGRVGVALLVVDDAAAVGGTAQGDVVEAEPVPRSRKRCGSCASCGARCRRGRGRSGASSGWRSGAARRQVRSSGRVVRSWVNLISPKCRREPYRMAPFPSRRPWRATYTTNRTTAVPVSHASTGS